ncbi:MAG: PEGA domain-containing protein [Clostridium sp.]|uniref:TcaA 3rd/4th domain-containing protein n=1 Tax=Clostridium sp. TaxID=1506 RepID=UPI002909801B|nr:PEGA domain-containing protein [Clostridium sp.]MDU5109515.1 PEGA domain-containing protein [Clostridium sp.]
MGAVNEILLKIKEYFKELYSEIRGLSFNELKDFIFKRRLFLISVLLIFILLGFSFGSYKSSKNIVLKNLQIALKDDKPGKIYKKIRVDGKKIKKEDLKPLTEYYSENKNQAINIAKDLKTKDNSGFFKLVNKKILFIDNYTIEIEPIAVKVNTNFENAKVYINNNEIAATNIKRGLIPGKYSIRGELETKYGLVSEEKEVFIMENTEIDLNIQAINISLTSNFNDADVIINDKEINKKVEEIKNYGPIPLSQDIEIQLKRDFPWGTVLSDKVKVGDVPNINININMANDKLIEDIEAIINNFYSSTFNALNNGDFKLIENSKEDAKSKIYDSIKRESLFLKNNYELNELKTEIKSSEFFYENGVYKGNIVVNLNYHISKKLIPFIDKNVEEMFLTSMEYNNGSWEVIDVQKFNLE